jgi:hypothetical protein
MKNHTISQWNLKIYKKSHSIKGMLVHLKREGREVIEIINLKDHLVQTREKTIIQMKLLSRFINKAFTSQDQIKT